MVMSDFPCFLQPILYEADLSLFIGFLFLLLPFSNIQITNLALKWKFIQFSKCTTRERRLVTKQHRRGDVFKVFKAPKGNWSNDGTDANATQRTSSPAKVMTVTFLLHFKCNNRQNNSNRRPREDRFVMRLAEDVTVANAEADEGSFSRAADERQDEEDFPLTQETGDRVQNWSPRCAFCWLYWKKTTSAEEP